VGWVMGCGRAKKEGGCPVRNGGVTDKGRKKSPCGCTKVLWHGRKIEAGEGCVEVKKRTKKNERIGKVGSFGTSMAGIGRPVVRVKVQDSPKQGSRGRTCLVL